MGWLCTITHAHKVEVVSCGVPMKLCVWAAAAWFKFNRCTIPAVQISSTRIPNKTNCLCVRVTDPLIVLPWLSLLHAKFDKWLAVVDCGSCREIYRYIYTWHCHQCTEMLIVKFSTKPCWQCMPLLGYMHGVIFYYTSKVCGCDMWCFSESTWATAAQLVTNATFQWYTRIIDHALKHTTIYYNIIIKDKLQIAVHSYREIWMHQYSPTTIRLCTTHSQLH